MNLHNKKIPYPLVHKLIVMMNRGNFFVDCLIIIKKHKKMQYNLVIAVSDKINETLIFVSTYVLSEFRCYKFKIFP